MASVRSVGTQVASANSVAASTNLAPGLPGTRVNGDLLLLFTSCRTAGPAAPATPAGWTSFANIAGTNGRIVLFGRVVDGAETAPTVAWTGLSTGTGSATPVQAQIASIEGLDTAGGIGSIVNVLGAAGDQTASTTAAAGGAAITTTVANAVVFTFSTRQDDAGTWATLAASDGITWAKVAATFITTSGADTAQEWQWGSKASAGSVAAKTFTLTGGSSFASSGVMIAFKAAPPPTATPVARVSLEAGNTPLTRTQHRIALRARKASGTGTVLLKAALYEGSTNRSGDLVVGTMTTSLADYVVAVSDASAAAITSYSDLELRLWATSATGDTVAVEIAEALLEMPVAGVVYVDAAVALSGAGTLAPSAKRIRESAVALSGAATLISAAKRSRETAVNLSGAGTLTADAIVIAGGPTYVDAAVSLSGAGTLASVPYRSRRGVASLAAAGTLVTSAQRTREGSVALSGTGTLTVVPHRRRRGLVTISGVGSLTGVAERSRAGTVALSGAASLAVAPKRYRQTEALLTGVGTLASVPRRHRTAATILSGVGTLTATESSGAAITFGAVSLSGSGTLSSAAKRRRETAVTLSAIGTLTAIPKRRRRYAIALSGVGTLTVVPHRRRKSLVAISGTGTLVSEAKRIRGSGTTLSGIGTLVTTMKRRRQARVNLSGAGWLTTTAYAPVLLVDYVGPLMLAVNEVVHSLDLDSAAHALALDEIAHSLAVDPVLALDLALDERTRLLELDDQLGLIEPFTLTVDQVRHSLTVDSVRHSLVLDARSHTLSLTAWPHALTLTSEPAKLLEVDPIVEKTLDLNPVLQRSLDLDEHVKGLLVEEVVQQDLEIYA